MPEQEYANNPIAAPFAEPHQLRSRDILGLLSCAWPFIRPYWRDFVGFLVLLLPGAAGGLFGLMLIRIFLDVIGNGQPLSPHEAWLLRLPLNATRQVVLTRACFAAGAAALAGLPYAFFVLGYAVWTLQKVSNLFRVNLYCKLQELGLSFHSEERIGDAIFRMFQDSAGIPQVLNGLLMEPLRILPMAVANLGWLIVFNYQMALIALVLIPAQSALAWVFSQPLRTAFLGAREASAQATTRIEETLASIKAVKAFGREGHEATVYADENWAALLAERKARMLLLLYRVLSNFIGGFGFLAATYIGARQVVIGQSSGIAGSVISLGLFQGTIIAFNRIAGGSYRLAMIWGSLQDVGVAIARVFQILQGQTELTASSRFHRNGTRPTPLRSALAFERVTFGYPGELTVLNDVDLAARVGELAAVAGPSGAGKSTLIALLLRFFDPQRGRILLDGHDIREFDVGSWRQMLAAGLQNNPLLTGTVRDNVSYGRPNASSEEVRAALLRVGLWEFVDSLPVGLNTVLGERGAKLSTGQRQRLGVASALLRDAPILLLDEPTSALDLANEELLMRGVREWLDERPDQRLVIMTTHRQSAAAWADRLYSIARGKITEQSHWPVSVARVGNA
jgi:ATP-binding cassette, subfamily B, bacterial